MIEIIKFIILCGIFIAGVSTVVVTCQMDAKWRRLWLLLLVVVMIKFPVMTIGFHFGERHNVRGWEACWTDIIACGLACWSVFNGGKWRNLASLLVLGWILHLGILCISAVNGMSLNSQHIILCGNSVGSWYCAALLFALEQGRY